MMEEMQNSYAGLSPPSRAAWIEMLTDGKKLTKIEVAAFTGGVD